MAVVGEHQRGAPGAGAVELAGAREPALGERLDVEPQAGGPLARRGAVRARAQRRLDVGQAPRTREVGVQVEPEERDRVQVRVEEAREERAAGEIDGRPVGGARPAQGVAAAPFVADREDPAAQRGERLGLGPGGLERDDAAARVEDGRGPLGAHRASTTGAASA